MKLQPSVLVSSMSGKLSGGVLVPSRSGLGSRRKVRPRQPASNYNAITRARLASVQTAWSALDADEVRAWNELAKQVKLSNRFGDRFTGSGINLFQRLNNNLVHCGESVIEAAPTLEEVGLWTTFTCTVVHDGAVTPTFAPTPVPASTYVLLKATPPIPVGRQPKLSDFREIKVCDPAFASATAVTTEYQAKYGTKYAAGLVVYFRAYYIDGTTGQAGRPVQTSAVIS